MMKNYGQTRRVCMGVVLAALFAADSFGEVPRLRVSISAQDNVEKHRDKGETEEETDRNNKITTFEKMTETCTVQVALKNSGDAPFTGRMQWCFISDHFSGKLKDQLPEEAERAVFSPGNKEVTIPAGETLNETITSEPFEYEEKTVETENYTGNGNTTSRDYETGDVYKGYLILLRVDGEIVAKKANTSSYTKDEWVTQCLTPPEPEAEKKEKKEKKDKKD
jgi:hypothetical protein